MKKLVSFLIFTFCLNANEITPIPEKIPHDREKALLGKELFHDPVLSKDGSISCAHCHNLATGGDDGLPFSFGVEAKMGNVNSPTVFNAVFNFSQFWNGRAKDLKEQAEGPIQNPVEMAHEIPKLIKQLEQTHYKDKFEKAYKDGLNKANLIDAIVEFERTLLTPNSRFDKYLKGDKNAISKYELEGFELFKIKGCIICHHGVNVGGNHYSKFGAVDDNLTRTSLGRYEVTGNEEDKYFFKVPSLRNVALTAPYFHDGREQNLTKAINIMAKTQLGRALKDDEADKIEAFLKTLTGVYKEIK